MKGLGRKGLEQIHAPEEWIRDILSESGGWQGQTAGRKICLRRVVVPLCLALFLLSGTVAVIAKHPILTEFRDYLAEKFWDGKEVEGDGGAGPSIREIKMAENIDLGQYIEGYFTGGRQGNQIYEWNENTLKKCPVFTWNGTIETGKKTITVSFDYVTEGDRFYACQLGGKAVCAIGCQDGSGEVYLGVEISKHEFRTYRVDLENDAVSSVLPDEKYCIPYAVSPKGTKVLFSHKDSPRKKTEKEHYYLYDTESGDFWDTKLSPFEQKDLLLTEDMLYAAGAEGDSRFLQYDITTKSITSNEKNLEGYDMCSPTVAVESAAYWKNGICRVKDIVSGEIYEVDISGWEIGTSSVSVGADNGSVYFFTNEGVHIFVMSKNVLLDLPRKGFPGVDYLGMVYALSGGNYLVTAIEEKDGEYQYHYFAVAY